MIFIFFKALMTLLFDLKLYRHFYKNHASDINKRGEYLLDFVISINLETFNRASEPFSMKKVCKKVIDNPGLLTYTFPASSMAFIW